MAHKDNISNGLSNAVKTTIKGGAGDDTIRGYGGHDTLYGGSGRTFYLSHGDDRIYDFDPDEDRIIDGFGTAGPQKSWRLSWLEIPVGGGSYIFMVKPYKR